MKNVIFFGIGALVGSVVSVLCVKGHYQKIADEEIREIREVYRKKIASKELAEKNSNAKKAFLEEKSDEKEHENEAKLSQLTQKNWEIHRYEELREPYIHSHNVFSNPPTDDELTDFEDEINDDPYEIIVDHTAPSDGYSEPFIISEEEFASELFYEKVMLFYYTDGYAVLEDTDEVVDSIEEFIGPKILPEIFDMGTAFESDTVYVRNKNRSTDYGIIFTGTEFVQEEGPD